MVEFDMHRAVCKSQQLTQPPLALSVPLSRFTSRVGGGSAFYVRPHHTPQQIHIMKKRISLFIVGCLLSTMLLADDTDSRQKLVGTWVYSVTNTLGMQRTNMITKVTQYRADGTFDMTGEFGLIAPTNNGFTNYVLLNGVWVLSEIQKFPYKRQIGGSGIWRIEQGCFYSTFTHNLGEAHVESGRRSYILTNLDNRVSFYTGPIDWEMKYEIISITGQDFIKRDGSGRVEAATRIQ
jgi:hypothetical protein